MTSWYRRLWAATAVILAAAPMTACSGSDGEAAGESVIEPASMNDAEPGTITWCAQRDSSGAFGAVVDAFNEEFGDEGFELELFEFPESTDEWRSQFVQRQDAQSGECDIFGSDVVWTAEFANKQYLYDMTPYVEQRADEFITSTLATTKYDGRHWAVPFGTNVGFLYYRTDPVAEEPSSWQDAYAAAGTAGGLAYQASAYEGLTVNFLEVATAAGGQVLNEDGTEPVINSPENLMALELMVDGLQSGAVPQAVLTYLEEDTRRAFESDNAGLQRNWTYAYVLGKLNPDIANSFDIMPLPPFEGGSGDSTGILGGTNMVISRFTDNPGASLKAIDFITSEAGQVAAAVEGGQPATLVSAYQNPDLQAALPFWETLQAGIENATSRPVTPMYSLVSRAIYTNVNQALAGDLSPEQALEHAEADIAEALDTF